MLFYRYISSASVSFLKSRFYTPVMEYRYNKSFSILFASTDIFPYYIFLIYYHAHLRWAQPLLKMWQSTKPHSFFSCILIANIVLFSRYRSVRITCKMGLTASPLRRRGCFLVIAIVVLVPFTMLLLFVGPGKNKRTYL